MSTFPGRMREYQSLSIDRFDGINLKSTAYFLSHFHSDHTVGLDSDYFYQKLLDRKDVPVHLYCSDVTKILMLADERYKPLKKFIKVLQVEVPTLLSVRDKDTFENEEMTVTLIPAGHCPGSVMFLFEGKEGTVLYTGDFRWEKGRASSYMFFKSGDHLKSFKSIYIDTTFCSPEAWVIPTRQECCDAVSDVVEDWLKESDDHYVYIAARSQYGHEQLLKAISERVQRKIHVSAFKFRVCEQIPDLKGLFTIQPELTPVHACFAKYLKRTSFLPCGFDLTNPKSKVMVILPSTMWFTYNSRIQNLVVKKGDFYRACYSFHSSYSEVRDFVLALKPERVFPNVKPITDKTLETVQKRLTMFLNSISGSGDSQTQSYKPLGKLKITKGQQKRKVEQYQPEPDSNSLDFGDLEVPKNKKTKSQIETRSKKNTPKKDRQNQILNSPFKDAVTSEHSSDSDSSYAGSCNEEEEIDLFEDDKVLGKLTEEVMSQENIVQLNKTSFLLESFEGGDEDFIELSQALERKSKSLLCDKDEKNDPYSQNSSSNSQKSKRQLLGTFSSNSSFNNWLSTCSDVIGEQRQSTESLGKRADIPGGRLNDDDLDSCGLHLSSTSTSEEQSDASPDAIVIQSDKSSKSDNSDVQFVTEKHDVIDVSEDSTEVEILKSEPGHRKRNSSGSEKRNSQIFSKLCASVKKTYTDAIPSISTSSSKSPISSSQDSQPDIASNNDNEYDSDSTVPPTPTKVPKPDSMESTYHPRKVIDLTND